MRSADVLERARCGARAGGEIPRGGRPGGRSMIAATAELAELTVLHLDKDFDLVAEISGQPVERLRLR